MSSTVSSIYILIYSIRKTISGHASTFTIIGLDVPIDTDTAVVCTWLSFGEGEVFEVGPGLRFPSTVFCRDEEGFRREEEGMGILIAAQIFGAAACAGVAGDGRIVEEGREADAALAVLGLRSSYVAHHLVNIGQITLKHQQKENRNRQSILP